MSLPLRDDLIALTCDLIAIPSTADRPDQLCAVIDYATSYARAIPGLHIHSSESGGKPAMVATLRDTRAPAIMLNAHLDVVAARPEQYQADVRGERIYGRGSQDMKGAGAVLLRLMKDLAALEQPPDVGFMFVSDEEIGGAHGTGHLAGTGWRCGFFLAAEPTDLRICYMQKGIMWVDLDLPGEPAHGSRPWEGRNPILALRDGLLALEQRYPTPTGAVWATTATPTVIHGGDTRNRLPERVTLTLDVRHIPEESPDEILATLRACFPGVGVRVIEGSPPLITAPHDAQVQRLAACAEAVMGQPAQFYREHFGSDARFYSVLGVPAVCFGPSGAGLHSDEEWVDLASLEQLYEALRRFVLGANV